MTTNVPPIVWVNGSPALPAEADILTGVQTDIDVAFGGGVNPGLTTPQGQLAQSETAIIGEKNNEIAYIANQVNPAFASGIWQDAIGYIYFMNRIQAAGTVVNATCTGAVGTVIPIGSIAQDTNGYLYASTAAAIIPAAGNITVQFQNQTTGAIACAIGSLNRIYTAVGGWDTVYNSSAGSLGNDVESRASFELRRQNSVAVNAVNSIQSILAAVLAVPNVLQAVVVDNPSGVSINYGATNYAIPAHSVCVSVAGGTSSAVATAIWNKKPPGCGYAGNTTVTVYDTSYTTPIAYSVTYLSPASAVCYFNVEIQNNAFLPSNITTLVQDAILSSFYGEDGGTAAQMGQATYSGRYYNNVNEIAASVNVIEVYLAIANSVIATSFVVGQTYKILTLGSTTQTQWNTLAGTSGVTYAVGSVFTAVAVGVGTGTALQFALLINFGIDQLPTLSASNISVSLV